MSSAQHIRQEYKQILLAESKPILHANFAIYSNTVLIIGLTREYNAKLKHIART